MKIQARMICMAIVSLMFGVVVTATADDHKPKHHSAKWHGKHLGWTMRRTHRKAELSRLHKYEKKALMTHQRAARGDFAAHQRSENRIAPSTVGVNSHQKEIMSGLKVHQGAEREQLRERQKAEKRH